MTLTLNFLDRLLDFDDYKHTTFSILSMQWPAILFSLIIRTITDDEQYTYFYQQLFLTANNVQAQSGVHTLVLVNNTGRTLPDYVIWHCQITN